MDRLEEVVGIYIETDKMTERILSRDAGNIELQKSVALVNISQSLKNIDLTLAMILDDLDDMKGAKNNGN
jgi:hypothetical protein